MMFATIVAVETITPLHVGAGAGRGEIDLPVARDCFGLPFIPASGLKGALRDEFRENTELQNQIFGSKNSMGKIAIQDAYLLAVPARSLRGVWALITSPLLLRRLKMLAEVADQKDLQKELNTLIQTEVGEDKILISEEGKDKLAIDGKIVLNEDFELEAVSDSKVGEFGSKFSPDERWRLCIVNDNLIGEIANTSLLRRARVALDDETKIVREGGLWEEEDVPPHSFFASLFCFQGGEEELKKALEEKMNTYLILGGHETLGRGLVRLRKW